MSGYQPTSGPAFNAQPTNNSEYETKPVNYVCGDCDATVSLKAGDAIRCRECGHRVLYKMRTNSLKRDDGK
ncbi:hypothetical protein EJ05DRAFT_496825 [Pseudovirgaria hyperparasitica]|uniref:Metallothionein-I gene transcription activator n=1 Tax=Pseudovirgaria hyperparasitica TaxID=470096 RepID=A0A6A6WGK0_9PEZI|nr:uncharacterized protein EJ05DRAFT_496825 [Pseudovirgaria hyperparasitica]KAF2761938.1 hypothetical protein EJ05DRAFT_496825 [Pseudovirgaria hyperparasitica]